MKILLQIPNQLSVTGDSDLATFQQRADEVDSYWTELKIRVETRVKTSSTLVKFEKLAKQVSLASILLFSDSFENEMLLIYIKIWKVFF